MNSLKKFLQTPSAKKQNLKNTVTILAVLIATIAATVLVGFLTSLNSTPPKIIAPTISFQVHNNVLKAEASGEISHWKYVGPRASSACDASVFQEVLGFGVSFKDGQTVFLDFEQDQQKYYCFRATDTDNVTGYGVYHARNLVKPPIVFKLKSNQLEASLSDQEDPQFYKDDWLYLKLNDDQQVCDAQAFADISQLIYQGPRIDISQLAADTIYCFRLSTTNNGYIYRRKVVLKNHSSSTPQVTIVALSGYLYLQADQPIKRWQAIILTGNQKCHWSNFGDQISTSYENVSIIRVRSNDIGRTYCVRAKNKDGLWGYKSLKILKNNQQLEVTISRSAQNNQTRLMVKTSASQTGYWYQLNLTEAKQCRNKDLVSKPALNSGKSLLLDNHHSQPKIYCWYALNNSGGLVAAIPVWSPYQSIIPYATDQKIKVASLATGLNNYQYLSLDEHQSTPLACDQLLSGDQPSNARPVATALVEAPVNHSYCFKALDNLNNPHYSSWFKNKLRRPSATQVALARDLQLTPLGSYIFYQLPLKRHQDLASLRQACASNVSLSCYNPEDQQFHLLSGSDYLSNLDQLKNDFAIALYDYLGSGAQAGLRFELQLLASSQTRLLDPATTNLYLEDLDRTLYNYLILQLQASPSKSFGDFWLRYLNLFFTPDDQ